MWSLQHVGLALGSATRPRAALLGTVGTARERTAEPAVPISRAARGRTHERHCHMNVIMKDTAVQRQEKNTKRNAASLGLRHHHEHYRDRRQEHGLSRGPTVVSYCKHLWAAKIEENTTLHRPIFKARQPRARKKYAAQPTPTEASPEKQLSSRYTSNATSAIEIRGVLSACVQCTVGHHTRRMLVHM